MTNAVVSLTTPALAAQFEDRQAPASQVYRMRDVYRIRKGFAVVQFNSEAKGRIVFLPEGTELHLVGPSLLCKCFEVACKDQLYNIFQEDLLGPWSTPVRSRRGTAVIEAVGVCA
jgi:hypothetical protein